MVCQVKLATLQHFVIFFYKTLPLKCRSVTMWITFIMFLSDSSKLIDGALALSYNFIVLVLISKKGSYFYYY